MAERDTLSTVLIVLMSIVLLIILVLTFSAEREVSILFLGDTSMGYFYFDGVSHGEAPFENYRQILSDSDYVIANLEAPITELRLSSFEGEKGYLGWETEETPGLLEQFGVDAVSLANNHLMDFGEQGLVETLESLEAHDIEAFGAGLDEDSAVLPYVISGKGIVVLSGFEYRENYDNDYSFYAGPGKSGVAMLTPMMVRKAREAYPESFIIVFPHWGDNYKWKTEEQEVIAKNLVDAGADLIIGHGAHLLQEVEMIEDVVVVYSLGNFVFNSPGRYESKGMRPYSMIARLLIKGEDRSLRLYPTYTNNPNTGYQGRFLTPEEFNEAVWLLDEHSRLEADTLSIGKDTYGRYLELSI